MVQARRGFMVRAKARMNACGVGRAVVFLTVALASNGYSFPMPINILDTRNTTTVSTYNWAMGEEGGIETAESRTLLSSANLSDSLQHPVSGQLEAAASVGWFGVSALTDAVSPLSDSWRWGSRASAETEIRFTPLLSATTTINIQFTGWGHWFQSLGFVSLYDVTTDQTIWSYSWGQTGVTGLDVPWLDNPGEVPRGTASLTLETDFNAANTYALTMYVGDQSVPPYSPHILMELDGLVPVPEPPVSALVSVGSLVMAMRLRRRK